MAITATQICNLALIEVGATLLASFEADQTREGQVARTIWHPCRRLALAHCGWNGAVKFAALTQMEDTTPLLYNYAYEMPDDNVRVLSIHPSNDPDTTVPYRLAYQTGSGDDETEYAVLTNTNQAWIRYVFDQQDLSAMSPGFHDILSFELARKFAAALTKTEAAKELTDKQLRRRLTIAKAIDGQEDFPEKLAEGTWGRARFGKYSDQLYSS
jgi:hypothetical protein